MLSNHGRRPVKTDFEYMDSEKSRIIGTGVDVFYSLNKSDYDDILRNYLDPPEFFPEGLIAFADVGNGDLICFDYRKGKDNPDPPVVYWNHEANVGEDVSFVAKNFEEFMGMLREPDDDLDDDE